MLNKIRAMFKPSSVQSSIKPFRALFAWELGMGLGHVGVVAPVVKEACSRGISCVVVSPQSLESQAFMPANVECREAPSLEIAPYQSVSYSEYLLNVGFGDKERLFSVVAEWIEILRIERPDVLVADLAPFAILAARILSIPVLIMGSPFNLPPPVFPQPVFRHWDSEDFSDLLMEVESAALDAINGLLEHYGKPQIKAVFEMYNHAQALLTSYEGLDHFARDRRLQPVEYSGSIRLESVQQSPVWADGNEVRVFAYIRKSSPFYVPVMSALVQSGARVLACVPDFEDVSVGKVIISTKPFNLDSLGKEADVFVSFGNISSVQFFLEQGIPVACFPDTAERALFSAAVQASGLGVSVPGSQLSDSSVQQALQKVFSPAAKLAADRFSQQIRARHAGKGAVERTVDAIQSTTKAPHDF